MVITSWICTTITITELSHLKGDSKLMLILPEVSFHFNLQLLINIQQVLDGKNRESSILKFFVIKFVKLNGHLHSLPECKQTFTNFSSFVILIHFLLNSYPKLVGTPGSKKGLIFKLLLPSL